MNLTHGQVNWEIVADDHSLNGALLMEFMRFNSYYHCMDSVEEGKVYNECFQSSSMTAIISSCIIKYLHEEVKASLKCKIFIQHT